ncbi:MAG: ABC transporter ATP-binding protein [Kiritimatiellae bacterium]|nr:ABC transporter ATP-binding protein [Kiritimatiellia bacterium]MDW8458073.1 ABC transporter ATP-binding protein [Verrucomicrobiota bacterium]
MSNSVEICNVTKRFGDFVAVDRVSLRIEKGEFFSLLGPSGCGKTTLLRMIGGFEFPTEGTIRIGDRDVTRLPPYKRPVNMVFQSYALFPHLNVLENVMFGLRYKGLTDSAARKKAQECLALVRLEGFERRSPSQLSGGQRQRVALARALAMEPEVLLLDEPLAALDQKLRKEVQLELKNLQKSLGLTFVFVTHDQEEALTMSDRIAVMNQGRVEQIDASHQVFEYPKTEFVAQFMGAPNFFTGVVKSIAEGLMFIGARTDSDIRVKTNSDAWRPNDTVRFVVRPEKLDLRTKSGTADGEVSIEVTIEDRVYQGVNTVWIVRDDQGERYIIYEQNDRPFQESSRFRVGGRAFMSWNPRDTVVLQKAESPALSACQAAANPQQGAPVPAATSAK